MQKLTKSQRRHERGQKLSKYQRRATRRLAEKMAAYDAGVKSSGKNGAAAYTKPGNASHHA